MLIIKHFIISTSFEKFIFRICNKEMFTGPLANLYLFAEQIFVYNNTSYISQIKKCDLYKRFDQFGISSLVL